MEGLNPKDTVRKTFTRFLPEAYVDYVCELFFESKVKFSIVKDRSTKLGDFRASPKGEKHRITVNGNLNKYSFLITTLHEFAHLNTYNQFGWKVKPHGEEWKMEYRKLLYPVIQSGKLPKDIEVTLTNSLVNTKASSCTDQQLSRVLHKYDIHPEGNVILESLPVDSLFEVNGKSFRKGPLRRKRYVCEEISSNKKYLVNSLAVVKHLNK
jgi:SprT protein